MGCVNQEWLKRLPTPLISTHGQGSKSVAVIALAPGNKMPSFRLTTLQEVLPRELQRSFDGFGTAGHDVNPIQVARRCSDQ